MSILQNAIDSIALGIEDYESSDSRRLISCTRNLFAGVLLLFKHKLVDLSPPGSAEVLIKQRVLPILDPRNGLKWVGKGEKTVDVQQIRERFSSLNITVDWERVERINKYRNDIEHYHNPLPQDAVRALIADAFLVIRDFVRNHLGQDPLELLGDHTWTTLTGVAEVYKKEKEECTKNIEAIDWKFGSLQDAIIGFMCLECGSGLIDVISPGPGSDRWTVNFRCRSCGENWNFETMTERAITEYYSGQNYLAIKEGGDPATINCPECGYDTYVLEEDCCVICEESVEWECQRCGLDIPTEEIDGSGYCSWCAHMIAKGE